MRRPRLEVPPREKDNMQAILMAADIEAAKLAKMLEQINIENGWDRDE